MNNYAFVEGKKIKSAKFYWDWRFSLKNGTKPEKIKKTPKPQLSEIFYRSYTFCNLHPHKGECLVQQKKCRLSTLQPIEFNSEEYLYKFESM